jgi:hypothetical protein
LTPDRRNVDRPTSSHLVESVIRESAADLFWERKLMLNVVKPRYVLPVRGDFKRIHLHAARALRDTRV